MSEAWELRDSCGNRRAVLVANRCRDKLHRGSAERYSRLNDDTPLPFDLPSDQRRKLAVDWTVTTVLGGRSTTAEARGAQARGVWAACRRDAGSPRRGSHPARDVPDGVGARLRDRLWLQGCDRPRPAAGSAGSPRMTQGVGSLRPVPRESRNPAGRGNKLPRDQFAHVRSFDDPWPWPRSLTRREGLGI
jgi:hypothetical protein